MKGEAVGWFTTLSPGNDDGTVKCLGFTLGLEFKGVMFRLKLGKQPHNVFSHHFIVTDRVGASVKKATLTTLRSLGMIKLS